MNFGEARLCITALWVYCRLRIGRPIVGIGYRIMGKFQVELMMYVIMKYMETEGKVIVMDDAFPKDITQPFRVAETEHDECCDLP